jgi:hypothetical protein
VGWRKRRSPDESVPLGNEKTGLNLLAKVAAGLPIMAFRQSMFPPKNLEQRLHSIRLLVQPVFHDTRESSEIH